VTLSIITPAYNNLSLLLGAIKSVDAQTSDDWQHVVVHDGPSAETREALCELGYKPYGKRVFVELGRNWHGFMGGDTCFTPRGPGDRGGRGSRGASVAQAAAFLTSGKYIGYCDADCELMPHHVERCAAELDATGYDWTYSQVRMEIDGHLQFIAGDGYPAHGRIDGNGVVHKTELLKVADWRWGGDADWALFERWLAAGASFSFIPEATVTWKRTSNQV